MSVAAGDYVVRHYDRIVDPTDLALTSTQVDLPEPFTIALRAQAAEIDAFGHVNNTVYQRWMEACAWAHSASVGLDPSKCQSLGRGMALTAFVVDYLKPSFIEQLILILNWITRVNRLKAERRFQVMCKETGATLARGRASYVCIDLATGSPTRMPPAFVAGYIVCPTVQKAVLSNTSLTGVA